MYKIALGAGHGLYTGGKRCMKKLDPNETREWVLNDRICDYVETYLAEYKGYELLRLDDSDDGQTDVPLSKRTAAANSWGADIYLSVHHNAGVGGGTGGGIECYAHPNASKEALQWRDALYAELIEQTGLRGNRANPKAVANFQVLRETKMPAALMELGYMDSATDVPIIIKKEYAQKCARAIVNVIVDRAGLQKKKAAAPPVVAGQLHLVQAGAFLSLQNADKRVAELQKAGFSAYVKKSGAAFLVQCGAFSSSDNADKLANRLKRQGFEAIVKKA